MTVHSLQERLAYHVTHGANQYAPMTGVQLLREAIADKTADLYGYKPDANSEVTITAGQRKHCMPRSLRWCAPVMRKDLFDPSYDSYAPAAELSGGG